MLSPKSIKVSCPQCGNLKIWRDGLRETLEGNVQRWLCRNCGFRFSEKPLQTSQGWTLNTSYGLVSKCQIGATTKDAKNLETAENIKTAGVSPQADAKGKIVGFSFWLLKQGYSKATIEGRIKLLNRLLKLGANFKDQDSIKEIIAQQEWKVSRKVNAVDAYDSLLRKEGKTWTPLIYRRVRTLPFIPTETELDQLIAGCSKRMSTFLQLLKETGMRCGEACQLKWTDLDLVNNSTNYSRKRWKPKKPPNIH